MNKKKKPEKRKEKKYYHQNNMKYKKIKKLVPFCEKCNREITGDGSILRPYNCNCGIWENENKKRDYIFKFKKLNNK